jgi:hypothetical protein
MTGYAVRIAMAVFLPVNRRIGWQVLIVVQVHLIDTRHGTDNIQGPLKHGFVVLQHGVIKRTLDYGTDIIPVLRDGPVVEIHVDRSENQVEKHKYCNQ